MNDYTDPREILRDIERRRRPYVNIGIILGLIIGIPIVVAVSAGEWAFRAYILKFILER